MKKPTVVCLCVLATTLHMSTSYMLVDDPEDDDGFKPFVPHLLQELLTSSKIYWFYFHLFSLSPPTFW